MMSAIKIMLEKIKVKTPSQAHFVDRTLDSTPTTPFPPPFGPAFSSPFNPQPLLDNIIPLTLEALPTANSPFNPLELLAPQAGLHFFPAINEFFIFIF